MASDPGKNAEKAAADLAEDDEKAEQASDEASTKQARTKKNVETAEDVKGFNKQKVAQWVEAKLKENGIDEKDAKDIAQKFEAQSVTGRVLLRMNEEKLVSG
ncbi:unnamed protein product [Symbiodinium necroappetens]|uniref:Uncharacterized protein n=1 Tax=Symbiodinium necroappetens TaxID=1628268 RepID=A0A813AAM7_9DINO|nr:unnamed protein product [Symbiodinium necroappetens]